MKRILAASFLFVLLGLPAVFGQLNITNTSLPTGTVASAYAFTLTAAGGAAPYSWSIGETYAESVETSLSLDTPTGAMGWNSDADGWWLALPFEFPFYGVCYTQCYVTTEGYVHFKSAFLYESFSGDTNILATNCMIAADWKNISTMTNEFRTNENIYVSANSSTCLIRWVAHSFSFSPVNVTLELRSDGRIRVDRQGDYDAAPRTVGVSAGNGIHLTIPTNSFVPGDAILQFVPTNRLPPGLNLTATGTIYGVPSATGSTPVTFTVLDSANAVASKNMPLDVVGDQNDQPTILSNVPPAGATSVPESSNKVLIVYATDPESQPLHYKWTWNGGIVGGDANAFTQTTAWGDAGVYTARAYVADDHWTNDEVFSEWTVTVLSDNDGDGMPNAWERQYPGALDPWVNDSGADPDYDGVTNGSEYAHGSCPTNGDTDGDSVRDSWEIEQGSDPADVREAVPGVTNFAGRDGLYLTEHARAVVVVSNRAFVACGYGGLKVYSITNPASPELLDMVDVGTGEHADSMWVDGARVYLPVDERSLMILDATDPTDITVLGEYTDGSAYFGPVRVESNRAYLAMNTDLAVIDVTDPASPALLGQIRVSSTSGAYHVHGIAVRNGIAYCANYTEGLKTVAATNPAAMHITMTNEFEAVGVCDYAARDLALRDGYLFMTQDGYGLMSFSLADPLAPVLLDNLIPSTVPFPYDSLEKVWNDGNTAAVVGESNLWVIDTAEPTNLVELGRWDSGGPQLDGVHLETNRVAVASAWGVAVGVGVDHGGLRLLDVSTPASPVHLGRIATSGQPWSMVIRDGLAYVANCDGGLHIVDISNPTNLHRVGRYDTPGEALGVSVSANGQYALVADGTRGLTVLDVSEPSNILRQASLPLAGTAEDVLLLNDFVYVAANTNGLVVITNLASPAVVTTFCDGATFQGLCNYGSVVLAAGGAYGLYSSSYEKKGETDTWFIARCDYQPYLGGIDARRVDAGNQRAWVADPFWGAIGIDISIATNMLYLGRYTNPLVQDTWVEGSYVWFAAITNVTAFHMGSPVDGRNIMRHDVLAVYDPQIKSVWADRSNGLYACNVGPFTYDYGLIAFSHARVDNDEDGMTDAQEMGWFGSLAQDWDGDYDFDGLRNWGEWLNGTDPTEFDSDGDGMGDRDEYLAGTDPRSTGSLFRVESPLRLPDLFSRRVISWPSVSGRYYDLWRTFDLLDPDGFTIIAPHVPATPPVNSYTDTVFIGFSVFYRVETSPP